MSSTPPKFLQRMLLALMIAAAGCYGLRVQIAGAANQTSSVSPVTIGGLPYQVQLQEYDMGGAQVPTLHSFAAAHYQGQWVVVAGQTNGMHGFDIDRESIPERQQNSDVWVIDPVAKQTWSRSLLPGVADSGLTEPQLLSLTPANTQFEQVGDRLYMTGGFGDDSLIDPTSRDTFSTLTAFDLPGLVNWAKGGAGTAIDHIRQVSDPLFKVTGGEMSQLDGQMHLVFGQDFNQAYQNNAVNGEYTKQVRTFAIQDDGATLGFTEVQRTNPEEHFRRRDLNVYPTIVPNGDGTLGEGLTVLSGVFTLSRGAWTVPVEIDADGNPTQLDRGHDPLGSDEMLDADPLVFKQAMNNYHAAKLGLFSESSEEMHELLFGGITLQEYDPVNPAADANGFVTDNQLPNTNQITAVVRGADGLYSQHFVGEFPELLTPEEDRMRFGSNAEFFLAEGIETYDNGVINLDALSGPTTVGYIYGGLITNAPHVFRNPEALSSASGEIFAVVLTPVPEPATLWLATAMLMTLAIASRTRTDDRRHKSFQWPRSTIGRCASVLPQAT